MTYRILGPRPVVEPAPPAVEAQDCQDWNHWTAREVPATMNILKHISVWTYDSFLLGKHLGMKLLDCSQ